ncbi:MAG: YlxR family protein [Firmicutes bacterium]|nr:YlxR family protein [Bacillota bacterium]
MAKKAPPVRKIPERKCVGCQQMKAKRALLRIVRTPEGEVDIDLTGKRNGRGAYLCIDQRCLQQARKSRALERALDSALPEEIYQRIAASIDRREFEMTVLRGGTLKKS